MRKFQRTIAAEIERQGGVIERVAAGVHPKFYCSAPDGRKCITVTSGSPGNCNAIHDASREIKRAARGAV